MLQFSLRPLVGMGLVVSSILGMGWKNPQIGLQPALAQSLDPIECARTQESFGFQLRDWQVEHQGFATLNVDVNYRFINDIAVDDPENYPDFVLIAQEVEEFFENYPNETDYWELMNKKLARMLLDNYPQISSLEIKVTVMPTTPRNRFPRHSIVTLTRPNQCPLMHNAGG